MCLCAHGSDLSGFSLCFSSGVCACLSVCANEWETKCISLFVYACLCMRCCSTSSELSQEEIENPGSRFSPRAPPFRGSSNANVHLNACVRVSICAGDDRRHSYCGIIHKETCMHANPLV